MPAIQIPVRSRLPVDSGVNDGKYWGRSSTLLTSSNSGIYAAIPHDGSKLGLQKEQRPGCTDCRCHEENITVYPPGRMLNPDAQRDEEQWDLSHHIACDRTPGPPPFQRKSGTRNIDAADSQKEKDQQ